MGGFQLARQTLQMPQNQEGPLDQYAKLLQIKGMQQQQQAAPVQLERQQEALKSEKLQNEQAQRDMADQQKIRDAFMQANGDMDKTLDLAARSGVQPKTLFGLKAQVLEQRTKMATLTKDELANAKAQSEQIANAAQSVLSLPPEQRTAAIQQAIPQLIQDPQQAQQMLQSVPQDPAQQEQWLKIHALSAMSAKDQIELIESKRHNKAEEDKPTEVGLAVKSAQGDVQAEAALKRLDQSKRESRPVNNIMTSNDAKDIADAIENGDQPPTLQGLYRNAGPVRAELARRGVPLAKMEMDWNATKKYLGTLNGSQQTRLRQAITTASGSLDKIESLYNEFQQIAPTSGIRMINKASLAAAKQLPGRAGAVATALDAQIADLTSELGNVYMGGNSPTDHALSLAQKNLSSDWNKQTFDEALKQTRLNIKIRQNSIIHAAPAGVSADSPYKVPGAEPAQQPANDFFSKFGGTKR